MFELLGFLGQYICFFILHVCGGGSFPKPLSEKQEKIYLERCANGDKEARNKLVEHNLRLVAHIIKKYYGMQSEQDDLVSIGTIGLIKAVDTYDMNKNIRLSSYASRCNENVDDNIIDTLDLKFNSRKLGQYINEELDEREKKIIILRYGLDGNEPMTQKNVAKLLNISRSYVSRIETRALKILKKRFDNSSNL